MSESEKFPPPREAGEETDRADTPHGTPPFRQEEAHGRQAKRLWVIIGILAVVLGIGLSYWSAGTDQQAAHLPGGDTPAAKSEHQGMTMSSTGGEPGMKPEQPESVMVSARKQQLIGVRTEKATVLPITHTIRTVALVEVDERNLEHVNIKLEGWVEKLYVRFTGEKVKKDQMLFEIYSPELLSSQEEYLLALKAVRTLGDSEFPEVAESARRVLQSTRERFALWDITPDHIEDLERTGQVLRTLPLHAPISGYVLKMNVREGGYITPATDTFVLADLSNIWVLADLYEFEIPYVRFTGEKVKKDQMLFEIYSPELLSSQEEYLLALKAVRTLGDSEFPEVAESARRVLQSTRERFALWDITPDHIEDLERTGQVLRTLPLHAPISGYVLKMNVREGGYITPATDTFVLADLSNIWVLADLYEFEIPYVKLGQKAKITLPYFPNELFEGTVTYVYPVLDPKTRTVKVRFELPNPGWKLKPDMFANVTLEIPLGDRLVVPNTAVLDSGTTQVVFVDTGQGMFEVRHVTLGVRSREWYEVREGVKEGELVVTSGNFLIDSESSLGAATDMMMPGMDMGPKKDDESPGAMPGMKQ